eukprot:766114-Hanusia_phi.AAC.15
MLAYLKKVNEPMPYEWSTFGYEILVSVNPADYNLVGKELVLRHNASSVFRRDIEAGSCLKDLLKQLEQEGKATANKHIGGFCCVGERTRIGDITVKAFIERNFRKLLLGLGERITRTAKGFKQDTDKQPMDNPFSAFRMQPSSAPSPAPSLPSADCEMEDAPTTPPAYLQPPRAASLHTQPSQAQTVQPILGNPVASNPDADTSWPLLLYCSPDRACDTNREWINFLLMCQAIARTLGVSHQEAVYHNCIKMEMTRRQTPHISHFHCMQRMPGGDMTKIGELDLMVELRCGNYLVELKVCDNWRRYDNQIKKYINACHSMGYKAHGAAILNFNPKGVIECVMYDATSRHAPSPSL